MVERVLITGARAPAALDLARSFAAAGFEVHMADCAPGLMARLSRTPARVHRYAAPRKEAVRFGQDLDGLVAGLAPVLIVPTCEEVFHLAGLAASRPWRDRLFAPPLETLRRLHLKSAFAAEAAAQGLDVPLTHRITDRAGLLAFADQAADLVFKPDGSRFGTRCLISPQPEELNDLAPSPADPWVVQARVRGEEVSFYAVCRSGQLVAFSAYRSSWRLGGGAGYAFVGLDAAVADRLRSIAERLAAESVGDGQFACDAIVDEAGRPWLIECNPRATSGVHLFDRRPDLALALAGRGEMATPPQGLTRHVAPALWRFGLPEALRQGDLTGWREQRRSGQDVISAPADRAPVLGALIDSVIFSAQALAQGLSLEAAMTADIEWNGEALTPVPAGGSRDAAA